MSLNMSMLRTKVVPMVLRKRIVSLSPGRDPGVAICRSVIPEPSRDMLLQWFCVFLYTAFYADADFGTPYLKNSRLCAPWTCVSAKLGIPNYLPPKEEFSATLKRLLPSGPWQDVVETVLEKCYNDRERNYVTTCPGQALLHCTVDNLIENCPEGHWRKDDGCNPVSSLAGIKYMFTQSRYENLEQNLALEKSPAWFMRNYFDSKCCKLPEILNSTTLKECGFDSFLHYYNHWPKNDKKTVTHFMKQATTLKPTGSRQKHFKRVLAKDPLQCCDMSDFLDQSTLYSCGYKPLWDDEKRLVLEPELDLAPTTTVRPASTNVVSVVPLPCEKETCIFKKLNIISESGSVDKEAFSKFLDNFTTAHPSWTKAKARVITQCLTRANPGYEGDCEINKVLACTLDVLSENCPHANKHDDLCRHSKQTNTVCQISSSMYRPKNRRAVCGLPSLVNSSVLASCGVTSVSRTEFVPEPQVIKPTTWRKSLYECKDNGPKAICLMDKMKILNKYGFMDYFSMKDRIRQFTFTYSVWTASRDLYLNAAISMPRYKEYCTSDRKLLNVLDAILTTCPISKRKNTPDCNTFYNDIVNATYNHNETIRKPQTSHFNHMYLSATPEPKVTYKTNPLFDFGVLDSSDTPTVKTIDLKAKPIPVILPVYMRMRAQGSPLKVETSSLDNYKSGVFNSTPYLLHGKVQTTKYVAPLIPPGLP